jgi:hypothetical protein
MSKDNFFDRINGNVVGNDCIDLVSCTVMVYRKNNVELRLED